jgi:23S rRNA (cytidine1920-2'-O)/16S rRNA (cytidine1409-2'-O)-methyltransferase
MSPTTCEPDLEETVPSSRNRFVALIDRLRHEHPEVTDPLNAIAAGYVRVNGVVVTNPRGKVRAQGIIAIDEPRVLRGTLKLRAALASFELQPVGLAAADIGASTGGFTTALLEAGARRVYAIDAGYGQLLGSLRQDPRVVNLERTNLAAVTTALVPDRIELVTIDVSYVSLATAIPQLEALQFAPGAALVALVKPMYELGLGRLPDGEPALAAALAAAERALCAGPSPWRLGRSIRSPVRGRRGAVEFLVHASRR